MLFLKQHCKKEALNGNVTCEVLGMHSVMVGGK